MALTSILAPVDFSEDSAEAARLARMIANRHAGRLTLLHVDGLPIYTGQVAEAAAPAAWIDYLAQRDEALLRRLREFADRLELGSGVELALARGDAAKAIHEHVRTVGSDLVVIAPRGRGYGHQFLVGSVSAAIASNVQCPVLVARVRTGALASEAGFENPLLAVSDRQLAESALAKTLPLAEKGTTIHLMHVLEGCEVTLGPPLPGAFQQAVERRRQELQQRLLALAKPAEREGFKSSVRVETGDPSFSILCRVDSSRNGLVVVSRKTNRDGSGQLATPAHRMLKHSPVPVLVVPKA